MAEHRFLFVRPEDAGSIPAKSRYININGADREGATAWEITDVKQGATV